MENDKCSRLILKISRALTDFDSIGGIAAERLSEAISFHSLAFH